jgi:hypothetical protein
VLNAVADAGIADNATAVQTGLGVVAELLIGLLTNGGNRVDMGGATMRLAMMGGLFATLIVAVPPVVMQLFATSLGFAQNVMGSMGVRPFGGGGAGAPQAAAGGGGASGGPEHLRIGAGQGATPGLAPMQRLSAGGHDSGPAGGMAQSNNQQLINRANTMGSAGAGDGVAVQGGGQRSGVMGLANQPTSEGLQSAQLQQSHLSGAGELRLNKNTGVWEAADTARQLSSQPELGSGGLLPIPGKGVSSSSINTSTANTGGAAPTTNDGVAATHMADGSRSVAVARERPARPGVDQAYRGTHPQAQVKSP